MLARRAGDGTPGFYWATALTAAVYAAAWWVWGDRGAFRNAGAGDVARGAAVGAALAVVFMLGALVVRRIPDLNPASGEGQTTLFDTWRFHAFFTTTDPGVADTVSADKTHRGHAIIEQVHADLKGGPLAHLPSGVFTANSAWLVLAVIAFNLARTAGLIADHAGRLARATTATTTAISRGVREVFIGPHFAAAAGDSSVRAGPDR